MLDPGEVKLAVELHRRSYNLLKWLETAIQKGFVAAQRAHGYMDAADAAKDWLAVHYHNLPAICRPDRESLDAFARFFATYLTTSFDLVATPGMVLRNDCCCTCEYCSYLTAAPHLRPKKLTARDKAKAMNLKVDHLLQLAAELRVAIEKEQAMCLAGGPKTAADAALATYGEQLVKRMRGFSRGPAVLGLWRTIAWDPAGSPRKRFQLKADDILAAEHRLAVEISAFQSWSK